MYRVSYQPSKYENNKTGLIVTARRISFCVISTFDLQVLVLTLHLLRPDMINIIAGIILVFKVTELCPCRECSSHLICYCVRHLGNTYCTKRIKSLTLYWHRIAERSFSSMWSGIETR
jgi:hypothetical protein